MSQYECIKHGMVPSSKLCDQYSSNQQHTVPSNINGGLTEHEKNILRYMLQQEHFKEHHIRYIRGVNNTCWRINITDASTVEQVLLSVL